MVTHNSSNNFDDNVYESNSQTTVAQTYDMYCNNNMISDQQLMSNTISLDQQPNVSSPNQYQQTIQQQYDVNYTSYQQYNNQQSAISISPPNVASPNHNQQYQQPNIASPNHNQQYQQPNVASPNHNQQYQQPNVSSPNHQQYDANHHNYQRSSGNNNHDSNNTNHNNNQPSSSNNDSSPQFPSPQSSIFLNITINSPQTNFIIIPNSDIRQILAFLNNPSGFQR